MTFRLPCCRRRFLESPSYPTWGGRQPHTGQNRGEPRRGNISSPTFHGAQLLGIMPQGLPQTSGYPSASTSFGFWEVLGLAHTGGSARLLTDRFKLKVHYETRVVLLYVLVLAKPGKF